MSNYDDLKASLGLKPTQLETGFEMATTVTTYKEYYAEGSKERRARKLTMQELGVKFEDCSHLNPKYSKSYAGLGGNGGKKGGGRNKKR